VPNNKPNKSHFNSDESEKDDIQLKKQLKAELNELVFFKIEMPSASSNKKIISCIEKIIEIINTMTSTDKKRDKKDNVNATNDLKLQENKENKINKFRDINIYEVNLKF